MSSESKDLTVLSRRTIAFYLLFFLLMGFFLNSWYRPYIYSNEIDDYGLADIGNNISFVPGVYFLLLLIRQKFSFGILKDIFVHTTILIFLEIAALFIGGIGTFDFKDIIGLLIGAGITYLIMKNKRVIAKLDKSQTEINK